MYSKKWQPSNTARREFAQKMQNDSDFADQYNQRKAEKAEKRRSTSQFDYEKAGGNYLPTTAQNDFCFFAIREMILTAQQSEAINQVLYGYSCGEKIHHDYIHIVNELMRTKKTC
jgi:hypothetical protein